MFLKIKKKVPAIFKAFNLAKNKRFKIKCKIIGLNRNMILISLDIKVLAYLTKLLKRAIRSLPLGMIIFIKPNAGCMTLPSVLVPLMLFRC